MKLRLLAISLASVTLAGAAVDTNHLAQVYDKGIKLYWNGNLKESALKMSEVVEESRCEDYGNRAAYMMSTLQAKMSSNESAAFQAEIRNLPIMSAFYKSASGPHECSAGPESFARIVEFAAAAPHSGLAGCHLDSLLSTDWPDDVISARLEAAAAWADLAYEQQTPEPHPRLQRLQDQLMRQFVARADFARQSLSEHILGSQPTPEGIVSMVRLLRTAGRPAEAYACYTNALARTEDPAQLGALMVRTMMEQKDMATARTSLEERRAPAPARPTQPC